MLVLLSGLVVTHLFGVSWRSNPCGCPDLAESKVQGRSKSSSATGFTRVSDISTTRRLKKRRFFVLPKDPDPLPAMLASRSPMDRNRTAAYGMYPRNVALPEVAQALNRAGFENEDICMVLSPAHPDAAGVRDANFFGSEGSEDSPSARLIAWFSKFGAVFIPTVGFFIRSLAFFDALSKDENLPALSRGSRALLGLGFSPEEANRLGRQLCDVGALIYVSCAESAKAPGVIELLRRTGAREAASLSGSKASAAAA